MIGRGKQRAPRNRTLTLNEEEFRYYRDRLLRLEGPATLDMILDRTIHQDLFAILEWLPAKVVDLLFVDPPYNLYKTFNGHTFVERPSSQYEQWLDSWLSKLVRCLKDTASVYICGDWRSSAAIHRVGEKYFKVRNRITWEREKGRGSKANWKNCSEDIWFFTVSDTYTFNVEEVKLARRVLAPYTDERGKAKDWVETTDGRFRLTYPSNIWTDITVPFWSMPENTDHPTQKPEKLLAKIILASSNPGDVVLDPFLGSGTTSVVASKLGRHYIGIEIDEQYCCIAEKRLDMAKIDKSIQGYTNGVFWERNTFAAQFRRRRDMPESQRAQDRLAQTTLPFEASRGE
ncbi:MAG: DNA-methyltransferase [Moorellales bacterium]